MIEKNKKLKLLIGWFVASSVIYLLLNNLGVVAMMMIYMIIAGALIIGYVICNKGMSPNKPNFDSDKKDIKRYVLGEYLLIIALPMIFIVMIDFLLLMLDFDLAGVIFDIMNSEIKICTLFSGSTGNAAYIKSGGDEFLIDAGVSCRMLNNALKNIGVEMKNIRSVFITHEHNDHIKGLETLTKYFKIPIFAPEAAGKIIAAKYPHTKECLINTDSGSTVYLKDTTVSAIKTPHDSAASICFNIALSNGKKLGYATDIGNLTTSVRDALTGCDYIIIESNHDLEMLRFGNYPESLKRRILSSNGHLSNRDCAAFLPQLVKSGTKKILLAHLSQNNNKPELAFNESRLSMNRAGINVEFEDVVGDVSLEIASPVQTVVLV